MDRTRFNRFLPLLVMGVVTLSITACQSVPDREGSAASAGDDSDVLADVREAWVTAYNAGDAATLAGYFADDAVMLPPNGPALSGKPAIETYLTQNLAGSSAILEIVSSDVLSSGDLAVERATYTATEGAAPDSPKRTGKYVMAFQRDPDGVWKIRWDTWNSSEPIPQETP